MRVSLLKDPSSKPTEILVHVEVSEVDDRPEFNYSHSFRYKVPSGNDSGEIVVYKDRITASGDLDGAPYSFALEKCRNKDCREENTAGCPVIAGKINRLLVADVFHTQPTENDLAFFGIALFKALFSGLAEKLFKETESIPLNNRIFLQLNKHDDLDAIPWEYAKDRTTFLVHQRKFARIQEPLPNHLGSKHRKFADRFIKLYQRRTRVPNHPLRIVAIFPDPIILPNEPGANLTDLHLSEQFQNFIDGFTKNKKVVRLERVFPPTFSQMGVLLDKKTAMSTVLHFMGHCGQDGRNSRALILEHDETGKLDYTNASRLVSVFNNLRLAFMSACDSRGVARVLVEHGVPYTIGSDCPIPNDLTRKFELEFYKFLANGSTLEAMYQARTSLGDDIRQSNYFAGAMVLYVSKVGEDDGGFQCEEGWPDVHLHEPPHNLMVLPTPPAVLKHKRELAELYLHLRSMVLKGQTSHVYTIKGKDAQKFVAEAMRRMAHLFPGGIFAWTFYNNKTTIIRYLRHLVDVIFPEDDLWVNLEEKYGRDVDELGSAVIRLIDTRKHATCLLILGHAHILDQGIKAENEPAKKLGEWLKNVKSLRHKIKILLTSDQPLDWMRGGLMDLGSDDLNTDSGGPSDLDNGSRGPSEFNDGSGGPSDRNYDSGEFSYRNKGSSEPSDWNNDSRRSSPWNNNSSRGPSDRSNGSGGFRDKNKGNRGPSYKQNGTEEPDWNNGGRGPSPSNNNSGGPSDRSNASEGSSDESNGSGGSSYRSNGSRGPSDLNNGSGEQQHTSSDFSIIKYFGEGYFYGVPKENHSFVDRPTILAELESAMAISSQSDRSKISALVGLGGMGKSQLMLRYCYLHQTVYDYIFWLTVDNWSMAVHSYRKLADYLGLDKKIIKEKNSEQKVIRWVLDWFEQRKNWLLLLDNADGDDMDKKIFDLLPRVGGNILITTRRMARPRSKVTVIHVDKMQEQEAILLLYGVLSADLIDQKKAEFECAQKIVTDLGSMPLAIKLAQVHAKKTLTSFENYFRKLKDQTRCVDLLSEKNLGQYKHSITTVWDQSFEKIRALNPAAVKILQFCAFLHSKDIPVCLFKRQYSVLELVSPTSTVPPDDVIGEAIDVLAEFSFVTRIECFFVTENQASDCLTVYPLVQNVIYNTIDRNQRLRWARNLATALNRDVHFNDSAVYAFHMVVQLSHICHFAALISNLRQDPHISKDLSPLLDGVIRYHLEHGTACDIDELAKFSTQVSEVAYGPDHLNTAASFNNLALLYCNQAKYDEAELLNRRALAIRKKLLGPEHPDTVMSLNNIADLYCHRNMYDEAELQYKRVLSIREKTLGPEHLDSVVSLNNIADLYYNQKMYDEAKQRYERVLAIREKVLGSMHPDTVTPMKKLARLYQDWGKHREAVKLYERVLSIYEKLLGLEHPDTKAIRNTLRYLSNPNQPQATISNSNPPKAAVSTGTHNLLEF